MVLFDINCIPDGMDVYTWFDLLKEGYGLYDGKLGEKPVVVDAKVALYDVNTMTDQQHIQVKNLIDEIIARRNKIDQETMNVVAENNKKLVEYLRELNKT